MGATITKEAGGLTLKHCTLWKSDWSPACRSVLMTLDAINLNVTEVDVNTDKFELKTPELIKMNQFKTLPILKDKELILIDSHAITTYLTSRYCNNGRLLPLDPDERSQVEQMLYYHSGEIYPKYKAAAEQTLHGDQYMTPYHEAQIEEAYANLEKLLDQRDWFSHKPWPMLSDICICATVSTLNVMVPIDKTKYPKLDKWLRRMSDEMYYVTANKKGIDEFSKRLDELGLLRAQ